MDLYKAFTDESKDGYFTGSNLNTGYDVGELSIKKLNKDKFRAKIGFPVDYSLLTSALENKATIYYFIKKGQIASFYIIRKTPTCVSCNEFFRAPDLTSDIIEAMDRQIAFFVAKEALGNKLPSAIFDGRELPKLLSKSYFSWSTFIGLGLPMAMCWYLCFDNITYAWLALIIGAGCAFSTKYKYEGVEVGSSASESASAADSASDSASDSAAESES